MVYHLVAMKKSFISQKRIHESLVVCLGKYGIEQTTFQQVADHCGVSQALVVKTYKNRENMIRSAFVELLEEAKELTKKHVIGPTAINKIKQYASISLEIFQLRKETARLYVLLYYLASFDERYLQLNTLIKETAVERIQQILQEGKASGELSTSALDSPMQAKAFHSALTGILLNSATEKSTVDPKGLVNTLVDNFLKALGTHDDHA